MKTSATTDVVRTVAIRIIADFPDGIRQSELFKTTERVVSEAYAIESRHIIRNSLWNLDEVHPEYVVKERVSPRQVLYKPTELLLAARSNPTEMSSNVEIKTERSERVQQYLKYLTMLLDAAQRYNGDVEITLFNIPNDVLFGMTEQEREAVYMLKRAFADIYRYGEVIRRVKDIWE